MEGLFFDKKDKTFRVECSYINFDLEEGKVAITKGSETNHDGIFISDVSGMITLGYLGEETGVIISDHFGGCDFHMLRTSFGWVLGAHVYSNEKCLFLMANELPKGLKTIGKWKSRGLGTGEVNGKGIN
jgi:hypothetical protein